MCEVLSQVWADLDSLRRTDDCLEIRPHADYTCEACGGPKQFDVYDDLPVCIDCGRVDFEFVSDEPEWRSGGDADGPGGDPSRVGAPVNTDHFSAAWGNSTVMSVKNGSYKQKRLAMINLHTSMNHKDRALFHAYQDLDKVGKQILNLPDCVMYSAKIKYKAFNEAVLTRGAVRNGIKANCIFQACREFNVARTTKEIADAFGIPARDISRTFDMYQEQVPETEVHVTTAADLVPRFFNEITCVPDAQKGRVKAKVINTCKDLAECVELMGRTPKAVACAVMFVVIKDSGFEIDKADLCKICGVSVPTLGKIESIVRNLRNCV
jgi:transcription initiation factor TFIIIB Brf1 subunit/transcription initiation factor TFIIB